MAAFLAGYAVATKWTAILIMIPLLSILALQRFDRKEFFFSFLPLLAGFTSGGFQLFLKPSLYINSAIREWQAGAEGNFFFWLIDTLPGWLFYLKTIVYGMGILLACIGIVGMIYYAWSAITSKNQSGLLTISFPILYFTIMGFSRHYFARYALPLIPFLTLFAGVFILTIVSKIVLKTKLPAWLLSSALILLVGISPLVLVSRKPY
jgi:hypothetical protein